VCNVHGDAIPRLSGRAKVKRTPPKNARVEMVKGKDARVMIIADRLC